MTYIPGACFNWSEPFFSQAFYFISCYFACYHKNGISRRIMLKEKAFYVFQFRLFYMLQVFTNRHPAVGMNLVGQFTHFMPCITIRFINIMLLKFFAHYLALHI